MKVLIDIGHPAHVHLFKYLAREMTQKGHSFFFTVREGENQAKLLEEYGFPFITIGRKQNGLLRKFIGIITFSLKIYRFSLKFKPDLFISHGSMYAGYAALLTGKKHIALEDTGNMEQIFFSKPVSDVILSPRSLQVDLGKKHLRYNGYHELAYLHPRRFQPDISVLNELGVTEKEKFVILRFISWNASHDFRQSGLTMDQKTELINSLTKYARVFISSEKPLPSELEKFELKIPPHRLHDALNYATMYIGEGATTASECAMLGTPALYINTITAGTLQSQEQYGLVFCFPNFNGLVEKAIGLLNTPGLKQIFLERRNKMLAENIDVSSFLIWFLENYPQSRTIMETDPSFQMSFQN